MRIGGKRPLRVGIIYSSGGSAFEAAATAIRDMPIEWVVCTDRDCGGEQVAQRLGITPIRIADRDKASFSRRAAELLLARNVDAALLFFDRLVSRELYSALPVFTINPALLPAFPGIDAVSKARKAGVRIMGATLHLVNEGVDTGPILAQVSDVVDPQWPEALWMRMSYRQKVCLTLWFVDALFSARIDCDPPTSLAVRTFVEDERTTTNLTFADPVIAEAMKEWLQSNPIVRPDPAYHN